MKPSVSLLSGLAFTHRTLLRFDKQSTGKQSEGEEQCAQGNSASLLSSSLSSWVEEVSHSLPATLRPKEVIPGFVPFPLPRYDSSMGFGPTTLRKSVPDILQAKEEMKAHKASLKAGVRVAEQEGAAAGEPSLAMIELGSTEAEKELTGVSEDQLHMVSAPPYEVVGDDALKVMDRLICRRSMTDLLEQFYQRPHREARAATVLDLASSLSQRTNEELTLMFYELTSPFSADGNGLQFLVNKVVKFGRPYYVTDELMKAYLTLLSSATDFFMEEAPHQLECSPRLCIQLLHFMALLRIFEPNVWFSPDPHNAPSNRGDYQHPRGLNRFTAFRRDGEVLYDAIVSLILGDGEEVNPFLKRCSSEELVDLLKGIGAVSPSHGPSPRANGEVIEALWRELFPRVIQEVSSETKDEAKYDSTFHRLLENIYLTMTVLGFHTKSSHILQVLLNNSTLEAPWSANFFCAASQEPKDETRRAIVENFLEKRLNALQASLASLRNSSMKEGDAEGTGDCTSQEKELREELEAVLQGSQELLMSLQDKSFAVSFAQRYQYDYFSLKMLPSFHTVAERFAIEAEEREKGLDMIDYSANTASSDSITVRLEQETWAKRPDTYLTRYKGVRVHPIRTFLSDLYYIKSLSSVFILHSSSIHHSVDGLVAALRRVRGGKCALICTYSCLDVLMQKSSWRHGDYGKPKTEEKVKKSAARAQRILSQEIGKGKVVLLPFTEALRLHDPGVVCDEDLLLWSLVAFLGREIPLVKVHTLQHVFSAARQPHHVLKGGHSPLRQGECTLFDRSSPLLASMSSKQLRSVAHHVRLATPVKDPANKLYKVNPSRSRFIYRRDKGLFDKIRVTARNVAPGFSQGALDSDLRGLGFYTPDYPQPLYSPLRRKHSEQD